MKILKIIVLCILASPLWAANRPEDIPSKLTEVKARNWYQEKYRSWRTYLESNVQDKKGWIECFKAAQYSGATNSELSALASEIDELFPNTGEANWAMAKSMGYSEKGVLLLEKALADLKSIDMIADKIVLAEIKGTDRTLHSSELFQTNMMYPSILNYAYNTLMSVGENGVLITEGENTTIPIWVLQDELGIRRDVKILNLELLGLQDYQKQLFDKYGIQTPAGLENLTENNPDLSFYYALTLPKQNFELLNDKLYVVGLASLLSEKEINNYETLKENIEDQFLLDYLTVDFNGEPKTATGKTLETNYIVPFYLLKQYYDQQGNEAKSKFLEEQIKSIADRSQIGGRVNMLLSQKAGPKNFKIVELDVKTLDKRYVKVKDNIYASEFELDNRDYQFFLTYLEKNNYTELYNIAKFDFSGYDEVNTAFAKTYHYNYDKVKVMNYSDYPTMDITFEAAKLYCEWLTAQYNAQENRKYKKVKFRLPSQKEWTMAALGYVNFQSWNFEDNIVRARPYGDEKPRYFEEYRIGDYDSVSYPWYHSDWFKSRNSIVNHHGCYLANVKTPAGYKCTNGIEGDGFALMSPVGTYFSNDMGLYDVIGNVAEMINEPGKAMGGSWNHWPEESTITSINHYDERSGTVGFRVFMEVIEE